MVKVKSSGDGEDPYLLIEAVEDLASSAKKKSIIH